MKHPTPLSEARIASLREGGFIVFDDSCWHKGPGMRPEPIFACSSKDELLDFLEKRLAEHQGEAEEET